MLYARGGKEKLLKEINKLSGEGMEYLGDLYAATHDEDFIPQDAQDIFLF